MKKMLLCFLFLLFSTFFINIFIHQKIYTYLHKYTKVVVDNKFVNPIKYHCTWGFLSLFFFVCGVFLFGFFKFCFVDLVQVFNWGECSMIYSFYLKIRKCNMDFFIFQLISHLWYSLSVFPHLFKVLFLFFLRIKSGSDKRTN